MNMKRLLIVLTAIGIAASAAAAQTTHVQADRPKPKVTFIELGSVNCIPCKKMQPVMKAVEGKYGDQVKVIFYDVWTDAQKPYAAKYGIRLIPTQIFLDEHNTEFFRHEGFFPEKEIDKILRQKGATPRP